MRNPTKAQLEQFLGKTVVLTLFNGKEFYGIFGKTDDEKNRDNPNLYFKKNCYHVEGTRYVFRASHITKIKRVMSNEEIKARESDWYE